MTIHHGRESGLLQLITATLSLLLLAGMFSSGSDTDEDNSKEPAVIADANTPVVDFDNTL